MVVDIKNQTTRQEVVVATSGKDAIVEQCVFVFVFTDAAAIAGGGGGGGGDGSGSG